MEIERGLVLEQLILVGDCATSFAYLVHCPIDNLVGCPLREAHDNSFLDIDSESAVRNG